MTDGLAHSAARGALFTMTAQAVRIILQLLSVVVLARLLSPEDYGLLTIALLVVGVGEIFRDFGLTSASVQAPTLSAGQRDNLFWINTAIGVLLASLAFGLSWVVGAISGHQELVGILQALSVVFIVNGCATQYRAQLLRALRFKLLAVIDIAGAAIALIAAVVAALLGAGYWALVIQQLSLALVLFIGAVWGGRWRPRWYSFTHPVRPMLALGWHLVSTNLVLYATSQVDTVLVAARFGAAPLGLYNRAYQLVMTPLAQVRSPLTNVALPVLSRMQHERARFNSFVTAGQLALGYALGVPLMVAAGLAEPLVAVLLGSQWQDAAPVLRLFAVAGVLTTLSFVGYWVYVSRGLGKQLFRYTLVSTTIRVSCIFAGSFFGMVGIAAGYALAVAIAWPVSLFWLSRVTEVPVRALYLGATRILLISGAAGVGSWGASQLVSGDWAALGTGIASGIAIVAIGLLLPPIRRDVRVLRGFVRLMGRREARGTGDTDK